MSETFHPPGSGLPVWRRPLTAVLLCTSILLLGFIPQVSSAVLALDQAAAIRLNSFVGQSPVLDYVIRFVADDEGHDRLFVAVLLAMAVILWQTRSFNHRIARFSTFLFLLLLMAATLAANDYLEDVIGRRSPSMTMRDFLDVERLYKWDLDLTDKHTFPSDEALLFYLPGFILLRMGKTLSGVLLLLAGTILPLGICIFGISWLSDIYLGSAPIAFLLSAVAVETPVFNLRRWIEERTGSAVDQAGMLLPRWKPLLAYGRRVYTSQNVFHMEAAIKRYASEELPKLLEMQQTDEALPIRIEVPLGGLQSIVRIVTIGARKVVLRAYPLTQRQAAERHRSAAELLSSYGIRVPVLYTFTDERSKYFAWFLLEEYVEGTCPRARDLTDQQIQVAASELARLHMVLSSRWGAVDATRSENYSDVLLRRAQKRLSASHAFGRDSDYQENQQKILQWFRAWRPFLDQQEEYHLIHGKLHRENALFTNDGAYCLLDYTTLEWGMPAEDVVTVHTSLCEGDPDVIARFDNAYFSRLPAAVAERQMKLIPFFEAYMVLSHLSKFTKRMNRRSGKQKTAMGTQRLRAQVSLLELVENLTPPKALQHEADMGEGI